jgi:hypothetical protein
MLSARHKQTGTKGAAGHALGFALAAAAVTVFLRLAPYWFGLDRSGHFLWNLMPVGALALFAGARLRWPWAVALPLLTMLTADLLLLRPLADLGRPAFNLLTPVVYASFLAYALLGRAACRAAWPVSLVPACLLGSVQFFVTTNFFTWLAGQDYPRTPAGLGECFAAALPFFKNTLAGDLLYAGLFFGLDALAVCLRGSEKASQPV